MNKIGFIGCGNMAKAMINGIIESGILGCENITVSSPVQNELDVVKEKYNINTTTDNIEVVQKSDVVVLAIKPNILNDVINQISSSITHRNVIVTLSPGKKLCDIERMFGKDVKIVRTMPNTPAMVMEGMTALCKNSYVTDEEMKFISSVMESLGKACEVKEDLMNAVVAVSGSSPAYVYMFIEAMADAAVLQGMPRNMAYQFAAQAVYGSAKMVLDTELHPGVLKDMVCSPGGSTIEAVKVLEDNKFRSSVMNAMQACADKAAKM